MYYEDFEVSLPDDIILEIKFLKREEFRPLVFNDKEYIIVAEDDVGNFVGANIHGKVYFLDPCDIDTGEKIEIYASKDISTFCAQLTLYQGWEVLPVNASDEEIEASARQFAKKLKILNKDALSDSENFWSLIIEQMEDGLL